MADHRELARLRAEGAVVLFEARGLDNELQRAALLGVDLGGGRGDGEAIAYISRRVIGEALLAVQNAHNVDAADVLLVEAVAALRRAAHVPRKEIRRWSGRERVCQHEKNQMIGT